jgi:protein tyrosine/serine phosphatase
MSADLAADGARMSRCSRTLPARIGARFAAAPAQMFKDENVQRRWTGSRMSICVLLILVSGCVYFASHTLKGACSNDLGSPIRNFCVVSPEVLWRGQRPTRSDAQWLLEHRVGSVISLQLDDRRAFEAAPLDRNFAHSVSYFQEPSFSPLQMLSRSHIDNHVARFLAIVLHAPKPIYFHCRAGVDRTGVLAAAFRVLIEGASPEQAIAEMARFHSPWIRIDARYIRSLSEARQAEILGKVRYWESRLRPTAQFECLRGTCTYVPDDRDPSREFR